MFEIAFIVSMLASDFFSSMQITNKDKLITESNQIFLGDDGYGEWR